MASNLVLALEFTDVVYAIETWAAGNLVAALTERALAVIVQTSEPVATLGGIATGLIHPLAVEARAGWPPRRPVDGLALQGATAGRACRVAWRGQLHAGDAHPSVAAEAVAARELVPTGGTFARTGCAYVPLAVQVAAARGCLSAWSHDFAAVDA